LLFQKYLFFKVKYKILKTEKGKNMSNQKNGANAFMALKRAEKT